MKNRRRKRTGRLQAVVDVRVALVGELILRDVVSDDLPIFFEQQLDPTAIQMAAFTAKDPADAAAFKAHWARILGDQSVITKTIVLAGKVAGHIAIFGPPEERDVTYWIGREYWGRGLASDALRKLLVGVKERPLYARAANDNAASIQVLKKCGFEISGHEISFANARRAEIDEVLLMLKE